ncbi:MAG: recombinase family protein [Defluviitaleaceae bacterium]|nr:recombinase family protein [Defluviitaleaceae bacterium]
MKKIAVYVRKSKITETGKSIEVQKEKCIALARARFDVAESEILIYEDEGKSGFYADRPKYKLMLKDIEENKISAVICYKIDRISRRTIDLLNLVQQMEQKGIVFVSVSDRELDTSSRTGKIMIALLSAIAEFERDIIAERITDNMYELAKEGRWLGGECPLGYSSKKETLFVSGRKTTINHLEPANDEQTAVRRLYKLFLQTNSYNATLTKLNNEGFKTKKGKEFTSIAVKNILLNPVYAVADSGIQNYFESLNVTVWAEDTDFDGIRGIMAYNKTEQTKEINQKSRTLDPTYTQRSLRREIKDWIVSVGKHKGIINGAEWIQAQNIMADISKNNSARPKEASRALLSGLVRCVVCNSRMFVRAESGRYNADGSMRFRYVCDVKYRKKGGCENSPNVKGFDLDNFVLGQICKISSEESFSELLKTTLKSYKKENEQHDIKKRLSKIENEIKNQIANLRSAPESIKQNIYADIEALNIEREKQQKRLDEMHSQDSRPGDIEKAKKIITDFPSLIKQVDYERKLQLFRRIIKYITVKDETVHIFLKGYSSSINR